MGGVAEHAWMIQGDFGIASNTLGRTGMIGREIELLRRRLVSTIKSWSGEGVEKPNRKVAACISFRKERTVISGKGWKQRILPIL